MGNTVATSNSSGNFSGQEWYHGYGRYRGGDQLGTDNCFTAPSGHPKLDGTGLMYYNARYYDPGDRAVYQSRAQWAPASSPTRPICSITTATPMPG